MIDKTPGDDFNAQSINFIHMNVFLLTDWDKLMSRLTLT